MGQQAWAGRMVFAQVTDRDEFYDRLKDFMDSTLDVLEYNDHVTWAPGLNKDNNVVGTYVTGPAFAFAIQMPDAYANDPPDGSGYVSTFETTVMDLNPDPENPTVAEIDTALGSL